MERLTTIAQQNGTPALIPRERRAVVVAGYRTPFTRAFGSQLNVDTIALGAAAVRGLIDRTKLSPKAVDHVAWGGVIFRGSAPNTAREIVIDLKLPPSISAHTESMACASGLKSVVSAVLMIESGNAHVVIAGGSDSTSCSDVPLDRTVSQALALYSFGKIGVSGLLSSAGLPCGWMPQRPAVAERSTGRTMGYHADVMAQLCGVSRQEQDAFAMASHKNAAAAATQGLFADEIVPVTAPASALQAAATVAKDDLVRSRQDPKKAAALPPVFRKKEEGGTITAASASPLTDGAACCLLMSYSTAKSLGYPADVGIRCWVPTAIDPMPMLLLAPAIGIPRALTRAGLSLSDIDFFEFHEAFAGQVLATIKALASAELCQKYLGLATPLGAIDLSRVNIYGGSVSIGHPFGATGSRLVTNAARILRRHKEARYVLISVCAAGGLGLVSILEKIE